MPLAGVSLALLSCDSILDIFPPTIEIVKPEERIVYSSKLPIELEVSDNRGVANVEVFLDDELVIVFSEEPFLSQLEIPEYGVLPRSLKVRAYDDVGNIAEVERQLGLSQGYQIISPNGSERWSEHSAQAITWARTGSMGWRVVLSYSLDGGSRWFEIDDNAQNTGQYNWIMPIIKASYSNCRVRVSGSSYSDISDNSFTMENHFESSFITPGRADGIFIQEDYAFIAEWDSGMYVFDISNLLNPVQIGAYKRNPTRENYATEIVVDGNLAYLAGAYSELRVLNISDPTNPYLVSVYYTQGPSNKLTISGDYIYIAQWSEGGIEIVDISNPNSPTQVSFTAVPENVTDIEIANNRAYVAVDDEGLKIFDISNLTSPYLIGTYKSDDGRDDVEAVFVADTYAYLVDRYDGLMILDIANPSNPTLIGSYELSESGSDVYVLGDNAFVTEYDAFEGEGWLNIINISDPANPILAGQYKMTGWVGDVYLSGNYIYVAARDGGIQIYDISWVQ